MRWGSILAATMMTLATIASGWAEMTIKLKDGTVYQLPIEPEQIQSIGVYHLYIRRPLAYI